MGVTIENGTSIISYHLFGMVLACFTSVGEGCFAYLVILTLRPCFDPLHTSFFESETDGNIDKTFELWILINEPSDSLFMISFEEDKLGVGVVLPDELLVSIEDFVSLLEFICEPESLAVFEVEGVVTAHRGSIEEVPNIQKAVPSIGGHIFFNRF